MATILKRIMVQCSGRGLFIASLVVMAILAYSFSRIYLAKPPTSKRIMTSNYRINQGNMASQQQQLQQQQKQQQQQKLKVKLPEKKAEDKEKQRQLKPTEDFKKKPLEEEPLEEEPLEEEPLEEEPLEEKPAEKKPSEEKPAEKKPVEEKTVEKKPLEEKPVETKTDEEKPKDNGPSEKSRQEKPQDQKGTTEKVKKVESEKDLPEEKKGTELKADKKTPQQVMEPSEVGKVEKATGSEQKEKPVQNQSKTAPFAQKGQDSQSGREETVSERQSAEKAGQKEGRIDGEDGGEEDNLEREDYELSVPLEPKEAHQVVSRIQKTGNLLLDEFLSHKTSAPQPNMARWVHLDLKGAAPSLEYLIELVPLLKRAGATGLLIEYEDMFPYSGELAVLKARQAYELDSLRSFLQTVKNSELEAVPLVQTFAHMEFVLKHGVFQHLREDQRYPGFLNPAKPGAIALAQKMISQVMAVHTDSKYVHIGCDEVSVLGVSPESVTKMRQLNHGKPELYLDYVRTLATFVRGQYPGVQTLIWDDVLRQIPTETLKNFKIGSYVEPVIWNYEKNVDVELPTPIWASYSQVFTKIWAASAYKGASGSIQHVPDLSRHLQNHASWLKLLADVRRSYPTLQIEGIVLTGWSRYEHFSALCELLPAALPSLVACLQIVDSGTWNADVIERVSELLSCSGPVFALNPETLHFEYAFESPTVDELLELGTDGARQQSRRRRQQQCRFPGDAIFYLILSYHRAIESFEKYFDPITGKTRGQCNRFSLGHRFADPFAVEKVCLRAVEKVSRVFQLIEQRVPPAFGAIYGPPVAREWLEEYVISYETWLEQYYDNLKAVASKPFVVAERPEVPVDATQINKGQHQPN